MGEHDEGVQAYGQSDHAAMLQKFHMQYETKNEVNFNFTICKMVELHDLSLHPLGWILHLNRNQPIKYQNNFPYLPKLPKYWSMKLSIIWSNSAELYPRLFINIFQSFSQRFSGI